MKSHTKLLQGLPEQLPEPLKRRLEAFSPVYRTLLKFSMVDRSYLIRNRSQTAMSPYGVRIAIDDLLPIENRIATGTYKNQLISHFRSTVENRRLRLADVGANIGFYSALFGISAAEDSSVDAFEPVPGNLSRLLRNVRLNGVSRDVTVFSCAVGETEALTGINVPEQKPSEATVADSSWSDRLITNSIQVQERTLDSLYEDRAPPDVVHVDAEGAVVRILNGSERLLASERPALYLVLHPKLIADMGRSVAEMEECLLSAGYDTCYDIKAGEHRPVSTIEELVAEPDRSYHLYVEHPDG